jgi:hypothetical protein
MGIIIRVVQNRIRLKSHFTQGRMAYLKDMWKKEFDEYCIELTKSKIKSDRPIRRALEAFNNPVLVTKLLRLYLERC